MEKHPAYWTHSDEAGHSYYFAPSNRTKPPYRKQIHVEAIIDVAEDGTLAGVELIDLKMPPPPEPTMPDTPEIEDQKIPDRVQKLIDAEKMRASIGCWVIIITIVGCCLVCYWLFF